MQIETITVKRYCDPATTEGGAPSYVAQILVVEVATDEDITGIGFASAPTGSGPLFAQLIETILAPAILGGDPLLTDDLWQRMYGAIPRRGGDGIARICMSALDFALWDIKGKRMGVPVSTLFGGHRARIPTYANCAHHMPPDKLAERAAEDVANGHKALKIRGTRSFVTPAEATERVRQVRAAIGPDIRLMVDVNGSWDVDTAIQQLKAWENYDVYWLEEPVPPQDIPGYARVRERSGGTYIVGGEQHADLAEFRTLIQEDCVDIVQPNAAVTGGITDWLRIHAFATANNVPVSPWNLQPIHLHMAAGLPNVQWLEYFMPDNALLEFQTRLFAEPKMREEVTDEGVFLLAPKAPGLGLALDPEMAERSLVQGE
ncbi:MAG: mandelate racemase/muconate lactonizing enzyme family protein [Gammaproteobacteria bacterium]|nr:mandelate racemase/muconate lactonizing enzyme family protein [Gammaproteobacteria bacterium]